MLTSSIEHLFSVVRLLTHRRRRSYLVGFEDTVKDCLAELEVNVREVIGAAFNHVLEAGSTAERSTAESGKSKGVYSTRDMLNLRAKIQSGVSQVFSSHLKAGGSKIATNLLPGNFIKLLTLEYFIICDFIFLFFIVGGILLKEDGYAVDLLNELEHYLSVSHRYAQDDADYKEFLRTAEVSFIISYFSWVVSL